MSNELKPCPFCGDVPELPSGDGTQYEIECGGCGQAMASVQICDLMTYEERASASFTTYRYGEEFVERAKAEAIANWNLRTQPAEAEGAEVVAWRYTSSQAFGRRDRRWHYQEAFPEVGARQVQVIGQLEPLVRQSDHLAALSAVTAERDRLLSTVEDMELALQDAEERAESAGRNASAFEDRMGDLQIENGRLQDRIRPLMAFTQQMARQEGEPYFRRLARAAMAAKEG